MELKIHGHNKEYFYIAEKVVVEKKDINKGKIFIPEGISGTAKPGNVEAVLARIIDPDAGELVDQVVAYKRGMEKTIHHTKMDNDIFLVRKDGIEAIAIAGEDEEFVIPIDLSKELNTELRPDKNRWSSGRGDK